MKSKVSIDENDKAFHTTNKLVLFGDSLFGRCGKHLVLALEKKLNGQFDVYNCATGGWDSDDLVKKAPYIASLEPEVAIISVGTNDACSWKRVGLSDYRQNLESVLNSFKNTQIIFFPPPPVHEISRTTEKQISNKDMKNYNDAVLEICRQRGIAYVDSWKLFMPLQDRDESYHIEDGVHLNDHAYEMLFEAIAEVLKS
ncbi:MAG: GDSL-type esterase/lipase family protein [Candidatus Saccharimonadales bacterium]